MGGGLGATSLGFNWRFNEICHISCQFFICNKYQKPGFDLNDQSRLGVFVREIVFKVAPSDAQNWEIAMRKIAEATKDSKSDELDWLCYSNGSFEYWIVLFADSLKDIPTEFSIVEAFSRERN